jgi:carboxyl-terminal processing protease
MMIRRGILRAVSGLVIAIVLVLVIISARSSSAGAPLIIAALRVLEQEYVDPVRPPQILNAAVEVMRKATHLSAGELPPIPAGATESQAIAAFRREFARAAETHVLPTTQLAYVTTAGMFASLQDSHTFFLPPAAFQEAQRVTQGKAAFTGIGVVITARRDSSGTAWIFVQDVLPGSPAEAAGLKRFDRIAQVDNTSLRNANPVDASRLLRGPAGTKVVLVLLRGMGTLRVAVSRAPIRVAPVAVRPLRPGLAYLRVYEFGRGAGAELRRRLRELSAQHRVDAAILDLRGNPGGLVLEATDILGIFLPPGAVAARDVRRGEPPSLLKAAGTPVLLRAPLAVLIDGASASSSELVAAALKDNGRATLVGEKTAGALGGAVLVALPQGGMSVTVERIVGPHGERIEDVGVAPTLPVALTAEEMEHEDDAPLRTAVGVVSGRRAAWHDGTRLGASGMVEDRAPAVTNTKCGPCPKPPSALGPLSLAVQSPVNVKGGTDESQMRESLWKVSEMFPARPELLSVEAEVVGVSEHFLEEEAGFLDIARA